MLSQGTDWVVVLIHRGAACDSLLAIWGGLWETASHFAVSETTKQEAAFPHKSDASSVYLPHWQDIALCLSTIKMFE